MKGYLKVFGISWLVAASLMYALEAATVGRDEGEDHFTSGEILQSSVAFGLFVAAVVGVIYGVIVARRERRR